MQATDDRQAVLAGRDHAHVGRTMAFEVDDVLRVKAFLEDHRAGAFCEAPLATVL